MNEYEKGGEGGDFASIAEAEAAGKAPQLSLNYLPKRSTAVKPVKVRAMGIDVSRETNAVLCVNCGADTLFHYCTLLHAHCK